jgi:hypothetical protein
MIDDRIDKLERQIHDAIRFHRDQYEKAIKPLVDQLVQIQSLRPPRPMILSLDQIASLEIRPFEPPTL